MQTSSSESQRKRKKNKSEIKITNRIIPEHLLFYGLPKNKDGRYTRLQYIRPLAEYLPVKQPESSSLNKILIKMCTPAPEHTFEKELENTIIEIEEKFTKKVIELRNMMLEAGIEIPQLQE